MFQPIIQDIDYSQKTPICIIEYKENLKSQIISNMNIKPKKYIENINIKIMEQEVK
jgi:hypothetical protein